MRKFIVISIVLLMIAGFAITSSADKCPAAPAVAGLLLEAVGVDNRYGTGKEGGNYIADVAKEMGPKTNFHGIEKCNFEAYRLEIAKYLFDEGGGVTELFAVLESVEYEGTCNKFGTHLEETITLTFSNNVAIPNDDQVFAETMVHFKDAYRLGNNTNYMIYTAEGNQVTIEVVGIFSRPEVGDFVTGLNGIVDDANGLPVIVPVGGVVIEGIVTYDLLGGWKMDLYTDEVTIEPRFVDIVTYEDFDITGFFGVGYDSAGTPTGEITGTVADQSISMVYEHYDFDYTATFEGTIEDCDYISGIWSSTGAINNELWIMYRLYY